MSQITTQPVARSIKRLLPIVQSHYMNDPTLKPLTLHIVQAETPDTRKPE